MGGRLGGEMAAHTTLPRAAPEPLKLRKISVRGRSWILWSYLVVERGRGGAAVVRYVWPAEDVVARFFCSKDSGMKYGIPD